MKLGRTIYLLAAFVFIACNPLKKQFRQNYKALLDPSKQERIEPIKLEELAHLPPAVRQYLVHSGVVGKPRVYRFCVRMEGRLRKDSVSGWMHFSSTQYNFIDTPARLFYLEASMKHLPVKGFHCYRNGHAFMDIRLLGLFRVQYQHGPEMDSTETVTLFNDMCCMAPATLIDSRITWEQTDSNCVRAFFQNKGIRISAYLYFNEQHQLVNFVSNERAATMKDGSLKRYPWSTPLGAYKDFNGYRLASYAETIYAYPEGKFCYGSFQIQSVEYNVQK